MLDKSQKLTKQIDSIQSQIDALPKGKIICAKNGTHYKWYHSDGKNHTYIPKKDRSFAEKLAFKKYLSNCLHDLQQEKRAVDAYLRHHKPGKAEQLLSPNSAYHELLSSYFHPLSEELFTWAHDTYEHNPKFPEQLNLKTSSGIYVRSKSEALIDMLLHINHIPFRYECALVLGSATIYPDFTIRHPKTGETYYWEHFGLMDSPPYCRSVSDKLILYFTHGIIPTINLITTYETKENPLSTEAVKKIVQDYFL